MSTQPASGATDVFPRGLRVVSFPDVKALHSMYALATGIVERGVRVDTVVKFGFAVSLCNFQ